MKSLARDSGNEHDPLRALGNTYKWGDEKREEALLQFLWNISSLTLELGRAKNLVHLGTSVFHSTVMDCIVAYIMMLDLFKSRRLVASRMGNL